MSTAEPKESQDPMEQQAYYFQISCNHMGSTNTAVPL